MYISDLHSQMNFVFYLILNCFHLILIYRICSNTLKIFFNLAKMNNNSPLLRSQLVNRAEYVLSAMLAFCAFCLLSLPMFGQLFCRKLLALKGGMASSLVVYQSTQLIFLSTSLAYNFYMLYAWLFQAAQFNVSAMFWTGLWPSAATRAISSATFFLTLDRYTPPMCDFGFLCLQLFCAALAHWIPKQEATTDGYYRECSDGNCHIFGCGNSNNLDGNAAGCWAR